MNLHAAPIFSGRQEDHTPQVAPALRVFVRAARVGGESAMHTPLTWSSRLLCKSFAVGCILFVVVSAGAASREIALESSNHWAFQRIDTAAILARGATRKGENPIDQFLAQKLKEQKLRFAPAADKRTLIRRATQDLTGLPPTPAEINAFLADKSPQAFSNLVERLLRSPRYGERWGRHWMDVVRYADTAGDNADYPVPEARLYRDYIIDAFNSDKPFDQFAREQLAGDILAQRGPPEKYSENVTATGFLALSRRYGTGPFELWHLTLENTIETVGQAFLGLNLRCARCHDHKFDPVTAKDYYGLYGIFASTQFPWAGSEEVQTKNFNRQKFVSLISDAEAKPKIEAWEARIKTLKDQITALEKETPSDEGAKKEHDKKISEVKKKMRALEKPGAPEGVPVAYAVREGTPADVPIQRRGEPEKAGALAPRCAPEFLARGSSLNISTGSSGRLEFANWLTSAENPLFARVMVNRIWQHHFGQGLVRTPNNFGLRGDIPVHRELLDYLAARFVESRWSIKAMHRLIMNSKAYQQSTDGLQAAQTVDPSNRFLWHFERQRLDAEGIRDAVLFVAGNLDTNRPGPHPFPPAEKWTWTQHAPFKDVYPSKHRSVYLMTQRFQKHPFLGLFDGPDTNSSTESRRVSTVPQQALFAMNNPWINEQAQAFARRVMNNTPTEKRRIQFAYEISFGRLPTSREIDQAEKWLKKAADLAGASGISPEKREEEAWTSLARTILAANEFIYVD